MRRASPGQMVARLVLALALLAPFAIAPTAAAVDDPCEVYEQQAVRDTVVEVTTVCYNDIPTARVWVWNDQLYVMWWDMGSDAWVAFGLSGGVGTSVWIPLSLDDCGDPLDEQIGDPSNGSPLLEEYLP